MKQKKLLSCLLAAGFSLCTAGARADGVRFVSSISDVALGVIDLTPGDGVPAGYTYEFLGSEYEAGIRGPGSAEQHVWEPDAGQGPFNLVLDAGPSNASVTATGGFGDISVQGTVLQNLGTEARVDTRASQSYAVTLTAHSVLTVSGNAFIDLAAVGTPSSQYAYGYVGLDMSSPDLNSGGSWKLENPAIGVTKAQRLWLAYANPTDHDITVNLAFNINGNSVITQIPEPSTYGMLLAGLGMLGFVARRRVWRGSTIGEIA